MNTNGQYWTGEAVTPLLGNGAYGNVGEDFMNLKAETLEMFNSQQYQIGQHQLQQHVPHNQQAVPEQNLVHSQLSQAKQQFQQIPQSTHFENFQPNNNLHGPSFGEVIHGSGSNNSSPINHYGGAVIAASPDSLSMSNGTEEKKEVVLPNKRSKSKKVSADDQDLFILSKDDADLSEAELQIKRKAQNRAAQRAFRERKETKLKELETKLLQSQEERQKLMDQLDLIRRQNISILTENEILRSNGTNYAENPREHRVPPVATKFYFPKNEDDFIATMVGGTSHDVQPQYLHKVYDSPGHPGDKTLGIGALWDYLLIKAEEMGLEEGSMDILEIMTKLRGNERCHGFGPAYSLDLVDQVIRECCNSPMI